MPFVAGCQSARQPIGSEIIQVWDEGHWRAFAENQALGHFNASDISDAKMDEYAAKLEEAKAAGAEGANGVWCADDLATLAGYLGLTGEAAENFVASVERYSQFAEAGRDEDYAKPADMMWPINEGPFYAEKNTRNANIVLVTLAGLYVDGNGAVLDQSFEPIPGLYATGNASGGRFPLQYTAPMNGISIGFATVFGALFGRVSGHPGACGGVGEKAQLGQKGWLTNREDGLLGVSRLDHGRETLLCVSACIPYAACNITKRRPRIGRWILVCDKGPTSERTALP